MVNNIQLDQVLFLDIETVSGEPHFSGLPVEMQGFWQQKGGRFARYEGHDWTDDVASAIYERKAAIFAEFGRVIVISAGFIYQGEAGLAMKIKSFAHRDERSLLLEFKELLESHFHDPNVHYLCGHNIREFDVPYLCRRMVIHGIELPGILDVTGKKPWETQHFIDTMELWKFGDYKSFTSLALLAHILGVPTPKDDIDGSDVGRVYWEEHDLDRICIYCEKDVATVAQILKFRGLPLIPYARIMTVDRNQKELSEEE
jgi:DNA polymerase elongation subunit (family B)